MTTGAPCMHNACMTSITIRDVPDETRDLLAARARRAGQSMQQFLLRELVVLAESQAQEEWFDRLRESVVRRGTAVSADQILDAVHGDRR